MNIISNLTLLFSFLMPCVMFASENPKALRQSRGREKYKRIAQFQHGMSTKAKVRSFIAGKVKENKNAKAQSEGSKNSVK